MDKNRKIYCCPSWTTIGKHVSVPDRQKLTYYIGLICPCLPTMSCPDGRERALRLRPFPPTEHNTDITEKVRKLKERFFMTYKQKFIKDHPNAGLRSDGYPHGCPTDRPVPRTSCLRADTTCKECWDRQVQDVRKGGQRLDCLKQMPPLTHSRVGEAFDITKSECAQWMAAQPDLMQYLFNEAKNHGYIRYDPKQNCYVGIEYEEGLE